MHAGWMFLRTELRRRWRSWLALALILAGRLPDPRRVGEVDISFTVAQARHLRVGDVLRVNVLTPGATPRRVPFTLRVVGIDAAPAEFPPQTGTGTDFVWATPAFYARHHSGLEIYPGGVLRLRHGAADLPAVLREISRLTHQRPPLTYPLATQSANTERSIHLQAVALRLLALLLAVIGMIIIGQLLARQSFLEADDFAVLRVLGMSPRQLLATGLARAAVIGAGGAVAATALAVAVSPLFPVGLARIADPSLGMRADPVVSLAGALATVLVTVACAVPAAWRAAAVPGESAARSAPATILRSG